MENIAGHLKDAQEFIQKRAVSAIMYEQLICHTFQDVLFNEIYVSK